MVVAGNWKMNTTVAEGVALAEALVASAADTEMVEVAVLPPFTHLWPVAEALRDSRITVGAQDVFWERAGAFTGEISPAMLSGWCDLVLVGHSERRHILGETDEQVGRKLRAALGEGLRAICAVGETEVERDSGDTTRVVDRQLDAALDGVDAAQATRLLVAYEPVWAIGTGRTATPQQAQEMCRHIRERLGSLAGGHHVPVLYGGSVTPENAAALFSEADIDGGLVGGASLRAEQFAAIVRAAEECAETKRASAAR